MTQPVKLSPLHGTTQRLGARYVELGAWRLPDAYAAVDEEIALVRAGCGLADVTAHGKLQIEGSRALEAVQAAFGSAPEAIGRGLAAEEAGHVYRLRGDLFYLSTPPGQEPGALARLTAAVAAADLFVTVTDLTDALADLRLIGPASTTILSQVCGLDFRDAAFPDMSATFSSAAKTRQLIIRRDFGGLPAYTLIGDQSLAAYLWGVLMEAGREHGLRPVGVSALSKLERA